MFSTLCISGNVCELRDTDVRVSLMSLALGLRSWSRDQHDLMRLLTARGALLTSGSLDPESRRLRRSEGLVTSVKGSAARLNISQRRTPRLHTSDLAEYTLLTA